MTGILTHEKMAKKLATQCGEREYKQMINALTLLPCPFCGSKAHTPPDERGVVCTHCGAKMQYDLDPERKIAIKVWNTRTTQHNQGEL
jgi:Lar family restriction alleviation protein